MTELTVKLNKLSVVSGFLIFCTENREKAVKKLLKKKMNQNEISKMLCYMWSKLSTEQKEKYNNTAKLYNDIKKHNCNIFHSE